jgi:peptide/nickel transport system substrate-binding protein
MKRKIAILVALAMMITIFGGCVTPTQIPSGSQSSTGSESSSEAEDFSETGTLNLDWFAGTGTDSVFECPWQDMGSLYPYMVFDSLVKLETADGSILPALAKEWEISTDGKTYSFTIDENAKWHDGTAFTAEDVIFTFNTYLKVPQSSDKAGLKTILGVQDVIDAKADAVTGIMAVGNRVIFALKNADSSLIFTLAKIKILPKHLLKGLDPTLLTKDETFWKKPIGTGAYKINEVTFPNYFTLVRNDEYHLAKANIKNVLFTSHVTGGVESTRADIIAGKIDFAFGNAVNDITNAKNIVTQNAEIKMPIVPSNYRRMFEFNCVGSTDNQYNDDMQKVEVRQAINLLLDKEAIAGMYKGQGLPLTTFINPDLPYYNSDIPLFKRDVTKAKEMLTAAGFDFTRKVRILYYYDDQTTKDVMEIIKQNFSDAGITAEPFLATGDLTSIIYSVKNWDIIYSGSSGKPDPIMGYLLFIPDKGIADGIYGNVETRQATFGPLLDGYKASQDDAEKKKIGDQIQLEAYKNSTFIPIYGMNKIILYNSAKLKVEESIFEKDWIFYCDFKFDQWELLK